ncbi:DUF305 domain-containing protein [Cellulomonas fimi]|uniref:DUF305 domain-containing protein n=1 Tax=Cellulomonas fimi TaxID=1708 RepID=A0A7Y0LZA2_CELFI|nr:DUF305 domain-containing protein [Cellulomonas fimi]NMR19477.1 DUF305 domain-containing protein [Cellulomonas fimi]
MTRARTTSRAALAAILVLAIAVAAVIGVLAGMRLAAPPQAAPQEGSVEAGFARDMQAHHSQAVEMSMLVLERTQDPEVRTLASDVLLTQQQQAGQMYGWLDQWNLPQSSTEPAMAWMDDAAGGMSGMTHGSAADDATPAGGADRMPGMASSDDLARLRAATGPDADRLYLALMIPHHEGGVLMAQVAADEASDAETRRLAQTIVAAQTAELTVLQTMLEARTEPASATQPPEPAN